jgi:predicted DNA-binding transcriptional regulator AlpA
MDPKHINFDELSDDAFIRASDLVRSPRRPGTAAPLPFSNPTLWRLVARKSFPQPYRLSAGVTAWRVGEVRAWLRSSCAAHISGERSIAPEGSASSADRASACTDGVARRTNVKVTGSLKTSAPKARDR